MKALRILNIFTFPKKSMQIMDLQSFEKIPDDFATTKIALSEDIFERGSRDTSFEDKIKSFKVAIEKARKVEHKELGIKL